MPSKRVEEAKIAHLQPEQRRELLQLLDEFHDRFGDRPGRCDAVATISRPWPTSY